MKKSGIEVVEANLDDVKSLEKAFEGAYGVFGVTNFWEHLCGSSSRRLIATQPFSSKDGEIQQGKNLGDAAKSAGIKYKLPSLLFSPVTLNRHLIWSTLDQSGVPHFDTKQVIGNYITKIGAHAKFFGL